MFGRAVASAVLIGLVAVIVGACEPVDDEPTRPPTWTPIPALATVSPAREVDWALIDEGCIAVGEAITKGYAQGMVEEQIVVGIANEVSASPLQVMELIDGCADYLQATYPP